ncbi:MAG: enoyl-CoA hydratase [Pseudomonadota bacterium]|nr:enoyl-CoA hydratase [Pseudomonadota bacterium]
MSAKPASDKVEPYVLRQRSGAAMTLSLNRGEHFNPLSLAMITALQATLDEIAEDSSIRVIVLRGEGRGFCAGHDLGEMQRLKGDVARLTELFESCNRLMVTITQLPQPVIARVHGIATAAGCQLVSMCDLAVADESAKFAMPGINIGVFCSTPAVGVARNIGRKRSMEMLLTGDVIAAARALEWGLVNRVVPSDSLDDEILRFTDRIVARSGAVIALGKKAFYEQLDSGLESAYAIAARAMARNLEFGDAGEGIAAFFAKRPPGWRNL